MWCEDSERELLPLLWYRCLMWQQLIRWTVYLHTVCLHLTRLLKALTDLLTVSLHACFRIGRCHGVVLWMEYHLTDDITVSTGLIGPISEQVWCCHFHLFLLYFDAFVVCHSIVGPQPTTFLQYRNLPVISSINYCSFKRTDREAANAQSGTDRHTACLKKWFINYCNS